jgi:hypothetical protein
MNIKLVARCERHQVTLNGDLYLVEADGGWVPDTSDMNCLLPSMDCQETWTVSIQA